MVLFFGPSLPTSPPKLRLAALVPKMSRCKRCNGKSDSWWKVCCHAPAVAVALRTMLKNLNFFAKKKHGGWRKDREITLPQNKKPWKHSVWVYICVLLLPENMGHLGGPKWQNGGKRTIRKITPLTPMVTQSSWQRNPPSWLGSISSLFGHKINKTCLLDVSKMNKPPQIFTGNLVIFWGQASVLPRNHHLP